MNTHKEMKKLFKEASLEKLTFFEKIVIKAKAMGIAGLPLPFSSIWKRDAAGALALFSGMPARKMLISSLASLFVLVGAGGVYAMERSLPGDLLYETKLATHDIVGDVLSLSPEHGLKYRVSEINERVNELEESPESVEEREVVEEEIRRSALVIEEQIRRVEDRGEKDASEHARSGLENALSRIKRNEDRNTQKDKVKMLDNDGGVVEPALPAQDVSGSTPDVGQESQGKSTGEESQGQDAGAGENKSKSDDAPSSSNPSVRQIIQDTLNMFR